MGIFEQLALFHLCASLICALFAARRGAGQAFCVFVLVLLIPIFGLLLVIAAALTRPGSEQEEICHLCPIYGDNLDTVERYDAHEAEVIPVQDALLLDDTAVKRSLLGNVIRKDVLYKPELLAAAIRDRDTEVSHYAVSAVTSRIEDMETKLHRLGAEEGWQDKPSAVLHYADLLSMYLKLGFLDEVSRAVWEQKYLTILDTLIETGRAEKKHYVDKIDLSVAAGLYSRAEADARRFLAEYPDDEEPFLMLMKLFYSQRDFPRLMETLGALKDSKIRFSQRALGQVRFWEGGQGDA